jgi:hypothetical protein
VDSIIWGRQSAAPTQNVDRHVATNKTTGSIKRLLGNGRRCESCSSGMGDHACPGGKLLGSAAGAEADGWSAGVFGARGEFAGPTDTDTFEGTGGNRSGVGDKGELGVLMISES